MLLLCMLLVSTAFADAKFVIVESLAGDGVVFELGVEKEPKRLSLGNHIPFWDSVQTSSRSAVKIRYSDGSIVVVGRDTKFQVLPKQEGTQYNKLDWGQVRAQVEKEDKPDPAKPPRFVIRTKTATMGVRGTDFMVGFDAASGTSELHTIEGVVDLAHQESQVMGGHGVPVTAGQQASLGEALSVPPAPKAFNTQTFVAQVAAAEPEMAKLAVPRDPNRPGGSSSFDRSAFDVSDDPADVRLRLLDFRTGVVGVFQDSGGWALSPMLSWNPKLRIMGSLAVRGHLGGFAVKRVANSSILPVFKGGLLLGIGFLGAMDVEAGILVEKWVSGSELEHSNLSPAGFLSWRLGEERFLERFFLGASYYPGASGIKYTNSIEAQIGVGVRL